MFLILQQTLFAFSVVWRGPIENEKKFSCIINQRECRASLKVNVEKNKLTRPILTFLWPVSEIRRVKRPFKGHNHSNFVQFSSATLNSAKREGKLFHSTRHFFSFQEACHLSKHFLLYFIYSNDADIFVGMSLWSLPYC